jgi:cob(I)alamin adenosyltransferase
MAKRDSQKDEDINQRHKRKMKKRKEFQDAKVARANKKKGLIMINTGNGKGKSSAAFGLIFRAVGHGYRVGVVKFIKGTWQTGDDSVLEHFPDQVTLVISGKGFTWETQDRERDIAAAKKGWEAAKAMMRDDSYHLIILDELNIAISHKYLPIKDVVDVLKGKREDLHVMITGRHAKQELIEIADLVTEMHLVKHHFQAGIKAQKGIEF